MSIEEKKSDLDSFWDEAYSRDEEKELKKQKKLEEKQKKKEEKLKKKKMRESSSDEAAQSSGEGAAADEKAADQTGAEAEVASPEKGGEQEDTDNSGKEKIAAEPSGEEKTSEVEAADKEKTAEMEPAEDSSAPAGSEPSSDEEDSEDEPEKKRKNKKKKKKKSSDDADDAGEDSEDDDSEKSEADEENGGKERDKNYNIVRDLFSLIIYIGIVIIICFLIITFVGQRTTVKGDSMLPTLTNKDNLWIDKLTYRFHDPKRFDIIVFPYNDDEFYIKRIIGLPGETVQIRDGHVYINGELLDDPYGDTAMNDSGIVASPVLLKEDQYFVLGDNRNRSHDSRSADVGFISKDRITGKAVFRLTPFKKFGKIK